MLDAFAPNRTLSYVAALTTSYADRPFRRAALYEALRACAASRFASLFAVPLFRSLLLSFVGNVALRLSLSFRSNRKHYEDCVPLPTLGHAVA